MLKALYTTENSLINGMNAIDVTANNISNLNSIGYKKQRINFSDLFYQNVKACVNTQNPEQLGMGDVVQSIDTIFSQGSISHTSIPTNVAIEGDGFFVVENSVYSKAQTSTIDTNALSFTRAGDFSFDSNNNLVAPNGDKVIGWMGNLNKNRSGFGVTVNPQTGIPQGSLEPINITDFENVPAVASTYVRFKANLSANSDIKEFSQATLNRNFDVLLDSNGNSLDVKNGDNFQISFNSGVNWNTFQYATNSLQASGILTFNTISSLISDMNGVAAKEGIDSTVIFNHGVIQIDNTSKTKDLNVMVRPTYKDTTFSGTPQNNPKLTTFISALNQTVQPNGYSQTQTLNVPTHLILGNFYDSTGKKHSMDIKFTKYAQDQWNYAVSLPNNDGTVISGGEGIVKFSANGGLDSSVISPTVNINLNDGANPVSLLINFWNTDNGVYDGNQFTGLTQFSLPSNTEFLSNNGSASGVLNGVNIDYSGNINASYSNGKTYTIAKLAIAKFANPEGLKRLSDAMFKITPDVDTKQNIDSLGYIGITNQGGRGEIVPSSLEISNVNLATSLTNMIAYQENFNANAKGLQIVNNIIQTAIQLNR